MPAPSGSGWSRRSSRSRRSSAFRGPGSAATGPRSTTTMSAGLLGNAAAGIKDRAEQQQLRAGEAVADLDRRAEMSGTSTGLACAISSERQQREQGGAAPSSQIFDREDLVGPPGRPSSIRSATSRMMIASAKRSKSGFIRVARTAPYCAPTTPPISSRPASTMSTERVVSAWTIVVPALTARIIDQAGADHDARRHAEQIDHRRNEDEAAADAEQHGQHAGDEARARAAPAARCRGPTCRSASAAEARRPSDCGAAARSGGRL